MREYCHRCRWPKAHCFCERLRPMNVSTKLVFLMHPHEVRHVKAGTGRFSALSFEGAEIVVGVGFDQVARVRELIADQAYAPMLLYPGETARNLSEGGLSREDLGDRSLLVFLLDATWPLAKKMLRESPSLQALPRLMFTPTQRSRFLIKRQPGELCLSTLEATHELMLALESSGLDRYERPAQLLDAFAAMQDFQIQCAADAAKAGYRRSPYATRDSEARSEIRPKKRGLFFKDPVRVPTTTQELP